MFADEMHELYRRWLDELWGGEPGAADALVSGDFIGHWPGHDVHGPGELAATVAETRSMFSQITSSCRLAARRRRPDRCPLDR